MEHLSCLQFVSEDVDFRKVTDLGAELPVPSRATYMLLCCKDATVYNCVISGTVIVDVLTDSKICN